MASLGPRLYKSLRAAATLSAYRVVTPDTVLSAGFVRAIQAPTETSIVLGLSQDSATTDQAFPVVALGYAKGQAGQSVSAGAILSYVTTSGYLIESAELTNTTTVATTTFSTSGAAMLRRVGIALQGASLTDAVIEVFAIVDNRRVRI